MRSIIVYIQEYPEQIHHPLEDMIYSILLERAEDVEFVQELITEHTLLEDVTRRLRASLESLSSGTVSKEDLKRQLSEFLVGQRQHIYIEEVEVYPLVKSVLTREDWKQLQSMAPLLDEPMFGRRTRDDYERLYREIEDKRSQREDTREPVTVLNQKPWRQAQSGSRHILNDKVNCAI